MGDAAEKRDTLLVQLTVGELDKRIEDAVERAVLRALQKPPANPGETVDTAAAAKMLGVTPAALRKLVSRKSILPDHRGQRGGGLRSSRFSMQTIQAFIERNRGKAK